MIIIRGWGIGKGRGWIYSLILGHDDSIVHFFFAARCMEYEDDGMSCGLGLWCPGLGYGYGMENVERTSCFVHVQMVEK